MEYYKDITTIVLEGESWHSIKGHEGVYEYSTFGRIRSLNRRIVGGKERKGIIMKQTKDRCGYLRIRLMKNGIKETKKVHRIVVINHILNPENKPEVNNKYGVKTDNRVSELMWATTKENIQHAYNELGKITPMKGKFGKNCPNSKKVKCVTFDMVFNSVTEASKALGLGITTISEICIGKSPHAYGMTFRYL